MKGNWLLLAGALAVAGNLLAATEVVVDLKTEVSPANPAFDACTFHGKTDKANPAAYRAGEPIVFTLSIERAGLGDYTCPPSGLAVLFNELKGEKSIKWVQGSRHGFVPEGENQEFEIRTY